MKSTQGSDWEDRRDVVEPEKKGRKGAFASMSFFHLKLLLLQRSVQAKAEGRNGCITNNELLGHQLRSRKRDGRSSNCGVISANWLPKGIATSGENLTCNESN